MANRTATLIGRVFACYLMVWAMVEITYLPALLVELVHAARQYSSSTQHDYWKYLMNYYRLGIGLVLLRALGLISVAAIFWKGGPRIAKLLSPPERSTSR